MPADRSRNVLVVSFRFPPHGGIGVQRVTQFTRYLPEFGWSPHVLTGPIGEYRRIQDEAMLELVPDGIPVTRTDYFDTRRVFRAFGRFHLARVVRALTLSFPNMNSGWIPYGYRAGRRLIAEGDFDLIYSSAYPMASHVVACLLARASGLPWVADYRDEWSLRASMRWPTPIHRRLGRWLDRTLTGAADRVVTTSPGHTASFSDAFPAPGPGRYVTITNGFDPDDFQDPGPPRSKAGPEGRFTISHVGSVFSWRTADPFLEAVRRLVRDGVVPADRIAVNLVGKGTDLDFLELKRLGVLRDVGFVSHPEAVRWMQAADVLLLINTERTNIPGKTFEYLAARRPILAAVRPGPTADLIREMRAGVVVPPDEPGRIAGAVRQLYERWLADELVCRTDDDAVGRYTRRECTRRLAELFDRVISVPVRGDETAGHEPASGPRTIVTR